MNKRIVTIGLVITAALAVGIGVAFRSVVSAVAGTETGGGALAQLEHVLNAGAVELQPSTGAPPAESDVTSDVVVSGAVAASRIDEGPGVLVTGLVKDGAAAKAGLARGDIILGVDGKDIRRFADLMKAVQGKAEGDTVRLKVQHGDDVRDLQVTLTGGGGAAQLGIASCGGGMAPRIIIRHAIGGGPAVVDTVTADSPAAEAGLKEGDRITAVDGEKLTGHGVAVRPADPAIDPAAGAHPLVGATLDGLTLADAIARHKPGDTVTLTVERDGEAAREVSVVLGAHPDDAAKAFLGVSYGSAMAMPEAMMQVMPFPGGANGAMPFMPAQPAAEPFEIPIDAPPSSDA